MIAIVKWIVIPDGVSLGDRRSGTQGKECRRPHNLVCYARSSRWVPALVAAKGPLLDRDDGQTHVMLCGRELRN